MRLLDDICDTEDALTFLPLVPHPPTAPPRILPSRELIAATSTVREQTCGYTTAKQKYEIDHLWVSHMLGSVCCGGGTDLSREDSKNLALG